MSDATYPFAPGPTAFSGSLLKAGPAGPFRRWLAHRERRRALKAVKDLPPYLLDDIGLLQQGFSRTEESALAGL